MAHAAARTPSLTRDLGNAAGLKTQLLRRWADYTRYRQTLEELRALSDRELNDLGMSRYDIVDIARESVYGE